MSISVDESGIPTPRNLTEAIAGLRRAADNSGIHPAYKRALRYGAPGTRHDITIRGHDVTIIVAQQPRHPANPAREHASWIELREAITGLLGTATGHHVAAMLPSEVAAAIWRHEGQEVRAYHPGAASTLRRARSGIRRRLGALSPLPLLGTLTQPLTGSATAVGIALAPVVPPMHTTPPPAPVVRELGGEIARPELPYILGLHVTAPATPRFAPIKPPDEATAPDTSPRPTADPTPPNRAPATTPTPGTSTSPTPTHTPVPEASSITSPAPPQTEPSTGVPLDAPQDPPSSSPTPVARTAPSTGHTPRGHGYGHRHGKHKQRLPHGRR